MPGPLRVVIVDDDSNECRDLIADLLREQGLEVSQFDAPEAGLTSAESSMTPVVLFLWGLRYFHELQKRIERRTPTKNLRILLATGAPYWQIPRNVSVLKKPISVEHLYAAILGASSLSPPRRGFPLAS